MSARDEKYWYICLVLYAVTHHCKSVSVRSMSVGIQPVSFYQQIPLEQSDNFYPLEVPVTIKPTPPLLPLPLPRPPLSLRTHRHPTMNFLYLARVSVFQYGLMIYRQRSHVITAINTLNAVHCYLCYPISTRSF